MKPRKPPRAQLINPNLFKHFEGFRVSGVIGSPPPTRPLRRGYREGGGGGGVVTPEPFEQRA